MSLLGSKPFTMTEILDRVRPDTVTHPHMEITRAPEHLRHDVKISATESASDDGRIAMYSQRLTGRVLEMND